MSMKACVVRLLSARDARLSFPLMSLQRPALTFRRWQNMLQATSRPKRARMFGVLNPAGCLLAIVKVRGNGLDLLAEPPPLLGEPQHMLDKVAQRVRQKRQ